MAAIVWADVVGMAPELSVIALGFQNAVLAWTNLALDLTTWGGEGSPQLKLGRIYYAAHFGSMSLRKGEGGAVSSMAAGGLSVGYALAPLGTFSALQTTSYGQMFIAMARAMGMARGGLSLRGTPAYPVDPGWDG